MTHIIGAWASSHPAVDIVNIVVDDNWCLFVATALSRTKDCDDIMRAVIQIVVMLLCRNYFCIEKTTFFSIGRTFRLPTCYYRDCGIFLLKWQCGNVLK